MALYYWHVKRFTCLKAEKVMSSNVSFINHACIQYADNNLKVLFDPWFSGQVFNNSWSLLQETEITKSKFQDVTHICISHEHPDHLHFQTLRKILDVCDTIPTLIFPLRANEFVRTALEKTGFNVVFAPRDGSEIKLNEHVSVAYFGEQEDHDNSIVLSTDEITILNQNDHYTARETVSKINQRYPDIDLLFTQFSLAGYYGNSDDEEAIIKNGPTFHIERLLQYTNDFKPKVVVPFASYVYFCHPFNSYLNKYIVTPKAVSEALSKCGQAFQLPWFFDEIHIDDRLREEKNKSSIPKLDNLFNQQNFTINKGNNKSSEEVIAEFSNSLSDVFMLQRLFVFFKYSLKNLLKRFLYPKFSTKIYLEDIDVLIKWNVISNKIEKLPTHSMDGVDLYAVSDQFVFMVKFPFGVDTFNIAACHRLVGVNKSLLQSVLWVKNKSHYY